MCCSPRVEDPRLQAGVHVWGMKPASTGFQQVSSSIDFFWELNRSLVDTRLTLVTMVQTSVDCSYNFLMFSSSGVD